MGMSEFINKLKDRGRAGLSHSPSGSPPPSAGAWPPGPGGEIVRMVYKQLVGADDKWSIRKPAGFTWWGHRQAQQIWTTPSRVIDGIEVARVIAETEVVTGVPDSPVVRQALRELNGDASFSAFNRMPDGRITLSASVIAHEGNVEWLQRLFNVVAALQVSEALDASAGLVKALKVTPAQSQHPIQGPRPTPDEMLGGIKHLIESYAARMGDSVTSAISGPSPYPQLEQMVSNGGCQVEGTPARFTIKVPFGREAAVVRVDTAAHHPVGRGVLDSLGIGVQVSGMIPKASSLSVAGYDAPLTFAEVLNLESRAELLSGESQNILGAWIPNPIAPKNTALTLFIPAVIAQGGIVMNVVGSVVGRIKLLGETSG